MDGALRGPALFAYSDNYLIDVKSGIIMDVEASRAIRQAEVGAAKTMIERTEQRFDIKPERLAGDTAYGSGANPQLAGQRGQDRAAYPGGRQVEARAVGRTSHSTRSATFTFVRPAGSDHDRQGGHRWGDTVLPGQDTRLPQLPAQITVLSEGAVAQNSAQHLRGGA
jgi:hypothetical protein